MKIKKINLLLLLVFVWVARNTIFVRQRDTSQFTAVDGSAIFQIAIIFLLFIFFFLFYKKKSLRAVRGIIRSEVRWLFLLYFLGFVSALWSPLASYSGYRSFECLVLFFALFVYFKSIVDFEKAEKAFLQFNVILLGMTFFGQLKLTGFSLSMITLHTNSYSLIALILFLYSFSELMSKSKQTKQRKKMLKWCAWVGIFFVGLGTSSATNVSVAIGIVLLAIFTNRSDLKFIALPMVVVSVPIIMMGGTSFIQEILMPGKSAESISSMTGRMGLWEVYITKIYEKPFFGWGFAVVARMGDHATTNTHNSILSILTGMGLAGAGLFFIFVTGSIRSIFINRSRKGIGAIGSGITFSALLVNAMSIAIIGESASPASLSLISMVAFYFMNVNKKLQQGKKIFRAIV